MNDTRKNDRRDICARATKDIALKVNAAIYHLLNIAVSQNGYGILADPSASKSDILYAQDQLAQALARLEATHWPTQSDYDLW